MKRASENGYFSFATEGIEESNFIPVDFTQFVTEKGEGNNDIVNDKTDKKIILGSAEDKIHLYGYIAVISEDSKYWIVNLRSGKTILESSNVKKVDVFSEFIVVYTKTRVYVYTHSGKKLTVSKIKEGLAVIECCTKKQKGKSYSHKALIDYKRGKVLINDQLKIDTAIEFVENYIVVTALKDGKIIKEIYKISSDVEQKINKIVDESQNCIDVSTVPDMDILILDFKDKGIRVYCNGKYLFEGWLKSSGLLNTHVSFTSEFVICTGYQLDSMVYDWTERQLEFKFLGSNCIEIILQNGSKRYVTSVTEKEAGLKSVYN
jgi:hypothetical protein